MAPLPGNEEMFSNPLAPPGDPGLEEGKPQRLTNADFRKLLMTPRTPASGLKEAAANQTGGTQSRPEAVTKTVDSKEDVKASERKKKKSYYARIKKEEEEKMAELAEKYRDRARERREGKNPDYQAEDPTQAGMGAYRAVAPDLKSGLDAAERRKQMIQESKFLGGDMEHTHLVKGLDYALLQKVRSEIQYKEQENEVLVDKTVTTEPQEKKPPPPQLTEEEELSFKTNAGRRIFNAIFQSGNTEFNDSFLPGRLAYSIDLEEDAESDIPITVLRSKADLMDIENMQATFTTNDIVIQKLTQILSYLRTGRAGKKQKKKEKGKEPPKGLADESIYGEIGDYVPSVGKDKDRDREKGRDRDRDRDRRDRDRDRRDHRDRDKGHDREERKSRSSYFSRPPQEDLHNEKQEAEKRLEAQWPHGVDSAELDKGLTSLLNVAEGQGQPLTGNVKNKGINQKLLEDDDDYYTECYPGMAEMQDAIEDSDDEADYTKMDLGNKKGPVGRWDFDTQEEYSNYMNQREAMPKAAFQYGVKMADGRKTRRIGGNKEKDRNAELNREWQQIQQILKRRKDDVGGTGDKRGRYDY
ncbi:UNVERIFIED_CONTAM: hypothetical protein RMT77_010690 [Armadillidium vulgare]